MEAESETDPSTVTICSQDPYPGDGQLLRLEQEILQKKYNIENVIGIVETVITRVKQEYAIKSAMRAHQHGMAGNLTESMRYYARSIEIDPSNIHLKLMRARLNEKLGKRVDALRDLYCIPKQMRSLEIWKMGGTLLRQIDIPVSSEFWFRKATKMSEKGDDEAAISFQQIRADRLYGSLCMGHPVRVEYTKYGKAVVATDVIKEKSHIFGDIPIIFAQSLDTYHVPSCSNCSRLVCTVKEFFGNDFDSMDQDIKTFLEELWPIHGRSECDECTRELYCNQICRQEAWDRYHCIICPKRNSAAAALYDLCANQGYGYAESGRWAKLWQGHFSPMVLARIWASVAAEAKRLMLEAGTSSPTLEHWARAKAPLRRFIAVGNSHALQNNPSIMSLMRSIFSNSDDGVKLDITEAEYNGRYYQAACNIQTFSLDAKGNPYYNLLTKLDENLKSLKLLKYLKNWRSPRATFMGLFPLHACMNHSCYNNVEVLGYDNDGRPGIGVQAKRALKTGDELLTTYIDTTLPKQLRRAWLYRSFQFWCQCQRCQFEGNEPQECTYCNARANPGKKFPGCSKCHKAWYCSVKCQKQAWVKGHKAICLEPHSPFSEESIV